MELTEVSIPATTLEVLTEPFTDDEIRTLTDNGEKQLTAIIRLGFEFLQDGSVDSLNDYVSEKITGSDWALEDISYKLLGALPDIPAQAAGLYLRVFGDVANYLKELDAEEAQET